MAAKRFAAHSDAEIEEKRSKTIPKNTQKANKAAAKLLRDYLIEKNQPSNFEEFSEEQLAEKRTRQDLDENTQSVLEEAFNTGLKSTKKQNRGRICVLAEKTGLSVKQIQTWIGNRRSKDKQMVRPTKTRNAKRGPSAYTLFSRGIKRGTKNKSDYMKGVAAAWASLSDMEKKEFKEKAKIIRQNPIQELPLEKRIEHHFRVIQQSCQDLLSNGFEVAGIASGKDSPPRLFGSPRGISFIEKNEIINSFTRDLDTQIVYIEKTKQRRNKLKEDVRQIFKSCWEKSTGLKTVVPYQKLMKHAINWKIVGLPNGLPLQDPSLYSLQALSDIKDAKDNIKFIKDDEEEAKNLDEDGNRIIAYKMKKRPKKKRNYNFQDETILDEFEVQYLVKDRNDGLEFLVHWKGFSVEDRTWEPASEMPTECVNNYWRKKMQALQEMPKY